MSARYSNTLCYRRIVNVCAAIHELQPVERSIGGDSCGTKEGAIALGEAEIRFSFGIREVDAAAVERSMEGGIYWKGFAKHRVLENLWPTLEFEIALARWEFEQLRATS